MNIAELRAREDYERILLPSVATCLTRHAASPIETVVWEEPGAQQWWLQPTLGGYFVDDPTAAVRTFLRDSLRYTPFRSRAIAQWALVSGLSSAPGLRATRRRGFSVSPPLTGARSCLLVPGNQRVRLFDFRRGVSTVTLKSEFSPLPMKREIAARIDRAGDGQAISVTASDDSQSWFQEPIIDAYALPRCPPWFDRTALLTEALVAQEAWSLRDARRVATSDYVAEQLTRCEELIEELERRFTPTHLAASAGYARRLAEVACGSDETILCHSHGDFQPGNILVGRHDRHLSVIDWEHAAIRSRWYDRVVMGLGLRARHGLSRRVRSALALNHSSVLAPLATLGSKALREVLFLVLLEDLVFALAESTTGPYHSIPGSLNLLLAEYRKILFAA